MAKHGGFSLTIASGVSSDWDYGNFIFFGFIALCKELNYQWKFKSDRMYFNDRPRFDANDFLKRPNKLASYRFLIL